MRVAEFLHILWWKAIVDKAMVEKMTRQLLNNEQWTECFTIFAYDKSVCQNLNIILENFLEKSAEVSNFIL